MQTPLSGADVPSSSSGLHPPMRQPLSAPARDPKRGEANSGPPRACGDLLGNNQRRRISGPPRACGDLLGNNQQMRLANRNRWLRPGLALLCVQAAFVAGWALLSPRSFFSDFPGIAGSWVKALPPYSEHLVRDVGGLYLGFAILFALAGFSLDRTLVKAVLASWLPFALLHLYFHLSHMERLGGTTQVLQTIALGAVAIIPALLLFSLRGRGASGFAMRPKL
jgi:hypothetical protein